jgi:murein DD-endopeptidase MepM/ murein hydrolase activator NlpD
VPGARPLPRRQISPEAPDEQPDEPPTDRPTTLAALAIGPPGGLGLLWPASGRITTHFGTVGWTSPRGHAGLDIAAPWGAPVLSAGSGRVLVATQAGGPYGYQIIVDHGDGLRTVYGHLSALQVETGQEVVRGEQIGRIGSTGFSTGPHLHFEVRHNGELRNPLSFLP